MKKSLLIFLLLFVGFIAKTQTYGSIVKIKHVLTNTHLHSHASNYGHPRSSGQQQVTAFGGADDNDYWIVKPEHGNDSRVGNVRQGDVIRLEHFLTRRNLHSHAGIPSPVSGQQEVTCFGENGIGDGNDNWRIEIEGGGIWATGKRIRLIHTNTNHALHSHSGFAHPEWTLNQQEVTCFGGRDDNDLWILSEVKSGMSAFNPTAHGFKFSNTFQVQPFKFEVVKDITFSGQCGGMVYAALDYYNQKRAIPNQTWRPALNTTLQQYIYNRQQNSFWDNLDKWAELFNNPFGARTNEFFNWGLKDRIVELKQSLDAKNPVPLGLFKAGNGGTGPHHQVLAIGYEMGRYKGDLGNFKEDFKIFIYDPNYPNQIVTLRANLSNQSYYYEQYPDNNWMTYFVDRKYKPASPPSNVPTYNLANDGMVRFLLVEIATGGDDLRGGNDNVNATIHFKNSTTKVFNTINLGARWGNNFSECVPLVLNSAVSKESLDKIVLKTTFSGGIGGDNWNMERLIVYPNANFNEPIYRNQGTPLSRFNGDNIPFEAKFFTKLLNVEVTTGGDDLRGHGQAYLTLHYRNGGNSGELPLNKGVGWGNNSVNSVRLDIPMQITPTDVVGVTIRHDGEPRSWPDSYDNWNLDRLKIELDGNVIFNLSGAPLERFRGDLRQRRWNR